MKKYRLFRLTLLIASTLLSVILILALLVPLSYGSAESYIGEASLQLARSNGFAKNALILEHGPPADQAEALSDLQVSLPLFVDEQNKLQRNSNQGVQDMLSQAQGNYLALVTATTTIINQPSPDPTQVVIIIDNSRAYNTVMNRYLMALEQQANDFNAHLVLFQESITVLLIIGVGALQVLWIRQSRVVQ